ncbi:putative RNA-directed DNA polymerase from transposon X-element [Araneus ventricosus]|uniref:Putative RNA-directed DNA polymerase from transposon X-element n=1 Tax=Araneus ventricosus TaxID=182803 RepID=A0A4Y2RS94_ARAVE|nr:putative RNA-directed DNA polymerase from transposon X-element [Araneus ventricosus]
MICCCCWRQGCVGGSPSGSCGVVAGALQELVPVKSSCCCAENSACYLVDGEFLFLRVLWQAQESFPFILEKHVDCAKKHFNEGATIVFDSYPVDASKPRLINTLYVKFQEEGFIVKQAEEHADYIIIKSALEIEKGSQCAVVVVGEDIDLLVMIAISTNSENIFSLSLGELISQRSGGTALLIRNSIDYYPTPIASDSFENTTIAIILPNSQQITVSSFYRPPHSIISTDELNRIFNSNNKCIVDVDFNAKHNTCRRNKNGNIINDYICNNNLILLAPSEPTHFPRNSNNPIIDFGILKNFSSGDATSLNEICSDHNSVSFEIDINANIPTITKTLKTTNWMTFYDNAKEAIPGTPSINSTKDIDEVINRITAVILKTLKQSSKAKLIGDPHRKLPPRITNKITLRNQIKKRWQITYDPRFKRKSTQLTNEIKADIKQYDQDSWAEWLLSLNQKDLSIYNATRKFSRKFHKIPPILDTGRLKYTPSEK